MLKRAGPKGDSCDKGRAAFGILQEHGDKNRIVFNDEGILQPLAWNFIALGDGAKLAEISQLIPPDFVTLHLRLPTEQTYPRKKARRKGIPAPLKAKSDTEALAKIARYGDVLDRFVAARRDRGCMVIAKAAAPEMEKVVEQSFERVKALRSTPRQKPAKKPRLAKA